MSKTSTGRLANLLLLAGVIVVMLVLGEVGLRIFLPQPTYSRLLSQLGSYYAPSDYDTFTLQKNYVGTQPSMEGSEQVRTTTNSLGLRGAELARDPRILMLGDSFTFGAYVGDDENFPALLEQRLRKNGYNYQVVNAGYADGYETDQQYVWLKRNIDVIRPRIVVLDVFLGNDIYYINPDAWADLDGDGLPSKWLDHNLSVQSNGIMRNKQVGANTVGVESIYRVPILRDSHLGIMAGRAVDFIRSRLFGYRGFEEDALQHIFGVYDDRFLDREQRFLKLVAAMDRLVRGKGAKFAVTLLPMNFMIEREKMDITLPNSKFRNSPSVYYNRLSELLKNNGIASLNIEDAMKNSRDGPFFPANGEIHFNRKGHVLTADRLYDFLRTGGYVAATE
jgi:lysophospholipase L1-like esterase